MNSKALKSVVWSVCFIFWHTHCYANAVDFMTGTFSLNGSTNQGSNVSISNFGIYQITFRIPFLKHFDAGAGYSVVLSNTISGEMGFGLLLQAHWYPFTQSSSSNELSSGISVSRGEIWRPFLGAKFSERRFQVTSASFAGLGATIGLERMINETLSLRGLLSYSLYSGNSQTSGSELDILIGASVSF